MTQENFSQVSPLDVKPFIDKVATFLNCTPFYFHNLDENLKPLTGIPLVMFLGNDVKREVESITEEKGDSTLFIVKIRETHTHVTLTKLIRIKPGIHYFQLPAAAAYLLKLQYSRDKLMQKMDFDAALSVIVKAVELGDSVVEKIFTESDRSSNAAFLKWVWEHCLTPETDNILFTP